MPTAAFQIPRLAVLMACHNRRPLTERAVEAVLRGSPFPIELVVFDDGSTDGTGAAVRALAPNAHILKGDGAAFWNRGMYEAWRHALSLPVDAFLWLNDDVELDPDAMARLLDCWQEAWSAAGDGRFVLVGSTRDPAGRLTYGGYRQERTPFALRFRLVEPNDRLQPIDTLNGNIVLVPRAAAETVGLLDPAYFHNSGDTDYGLRARRRGVPVLLAPGTFGVCEKNLDKVEQGFGSPRLSLAEQWRVVNSHRGLPFASWVRLTWRHSGPWFPLHFLLPYRRLVLPRALLNRLERRA